MELHFDSGTLVARMTPQERERLDFQGILWDSRIGAHRALALDYPALIAAAARASVPISDAIVRPKTGRCLSLPMPELRPYQHAALDAWVHAGRRGCIALPTGTGKTRVAVAAMAQLGCATLVLVPTRALLAQWVSVLEAAGLAGVGRLGDGERILGAVTVSTFESAYRHLDELGDRFDLLVIDEVHHFASGLRGEALQMAVAPYRLGLSATFPDDAEQVERLATLCGPLVYRQQLGELDGWLAPLCRVLWPVRLRAEERAEYLAAYQPFARFHRLFRATSPDGDWAALVRAAAASEEGRAAMAGWRRARALLALPAAKREALAVLLARHPDERILVFTANNHAAYAVSRERLLPALTCDIGRRERDAVLERFRQGQVRVLVSARVLNEGLDVPDASVGIVLGGTQGGGEHVQRVGRLLRPQPGKRATLYEVVVQDTLESQQSERRHRHLGVRSILPG